MAGLAEEPRRPCGEEGCRKNAGRLHTRDFGEAFIYMLILPMNGFAEFDSVEKQTLG
jgi:hypothetical protein